MKHIVCFSGGHSSANAAINNKETQKEKLIDIIENGI